MGEIRNSSRMVASMAVLLALAVAMSAAEQMLPPLPGLPPGVRPGLSNIVTMYTLFFLGRRYALALAALKSGFVLLLRGPTAGLLSLCGGLLAVGVIALLALLLRGRISYLLLSMCGAIAHNLGQMAAAGRLLHTPRLLAVYWPVLVVSGVVAGGVTGALLRAVMPLMHRVFLRGREGKGDGL